MVTTGTSVAAAPDSIITLADHKKFNESFLAHPVVSGNLLVGLLWNMTNGPFDPTRVLLHLPEGLHDSNLCIAFASRDGRYSAENLYDLPQKNESFAIVESNTKYAKELSAYDSSDIAITARATNDCNDPLIGSLLPVIIDTSRGLKDSDDYLSATLIAFLNADPEKLTVRLLGDDGSAAGVATCKPSGEGVRIAFRTECQIALPRPAERSYKIEIEVRERFKKYRAPVVDLLLK